MVPQVVSQERLNVVARASRAGSTMEVAESIGKPLREGLFAGLLDFKKLPFNWETLMLRAAAVAGILPRGDHRDWNAIRAWAESLKPILGV
jgi:menaquinone-dependent protoporphyrinogen IX oxidase